MKQQDVIEFFDQAAAGWDAQLRRNEPVIARILDNAGVRGGVRVLDVACGTGVLIPDYLQRGAAQVTAIDISPEMARIARTSLPRSTASLSTTRFRIFRSRSDCWRIWPDCWPRAGH